MAGSPPGRRCSICGSENHPDPGATPGVLDRWWVGFAVVLIAAIVLALLVAGMVRAL